MIPSFLLVSCNLSLSVCSLLCCRFQRVGVWMPRTWNRTETGRKNEMSFSAAEASCLTTRPAELWWTLLESGSLSGNIFTNDIQQCICILSPPKESRLQTAHLCIVILFTMHALLSMSYVLAIAMGTVAVLRYHPWCRPECFSVGVALRGKWSNHPIDVSLIPLGSANASPAPQG